jgi:hypothetical protein
VATLLHFLHSPFHSSFSKKPNRCCFFQLSFLQQISREIPINKNFAVTSTWKIVQHQLDEVKYFKFTHHSSCVSSQALIVNVRDLMDNNLKTFNESWLGNKLCMSIINRASPNVVQKCAVTLFDIKVIAEIFISHSCLWQIWT